MDTDSIGLEITLIIILIIANGVFALSEIAIVSSRKVRLEKRAEAGSRGAKAALELANSPTQLLSTVQIGITLIGIFTGAFGGATLAKALAVYLKSIPLLAAYSDAASLFIVVSGITYLSLIIGELVPKKIALSNPEPIAAFIAIPMGFFSRITAPIVWVLSKSTEAMLALLRVKESSEPPVTEDEIKVLMEQGGEHGVFERAEMDMVERIFQLGDMRVNALMTPRTQVDWLDIEDTAEQNYRVLVESGHSRFPIAKGSLDDIVGVIYTKDLVAKGAMSENLELEDSIRNPLYVPKSMKAIKVLEMFKQTGMHIAFVIDEYGGFLGLLTIKDILEQVVGDLPSIHEHYDPDIVEREDGSWLVDGMLPIDDLKELFDLEELPGEDKDNFQTLGGFITSYLGYIPTAAEVFEWNGLRFEIMDMDRIRVDKVLVSKIERDI